MPSRNISLLNFKNWPKENIQELFFLADHIRKYPQKEIQTPLTAALLFFEPSTRTRFSFETALVKNGIHPLVFGASLGTSVEKGESAEDTLLNIEAMDPSLIVVRIGDDLNLEEISHKLKTPLINAGWGVKGHPTQALLDIYTLKSHFGKVEGLKLLVVGDVKHSRVISSHIELAPILGYELAFCTSGEFLPANNSLKNFGSLPEGLAWSNAVMGLRFQKERHETQINIQSWIEKYQLNSQSLSALAKDALILHPGPVNWGLEMQREVLFDSRSRILQQVESGVLVRQALIKKILEVR